jgi:hypothetical protein
MLLIRELIFVVSIASVLYIGLKIAIHYTDENLWFHKKAVALTGLCLIYISLGVGCMGIVLTAQLYDKIRVKRRAAYLARLHG